MENTNSSNANFNSTLIDVTPVYYSQTDNKWYDDSIHDDHVEIYGYGWYRTDDDEIAWVTYKDEYYHIDDCVYLDYKDEYALTEDCVYCEDTEDYRHIEDTSTCASCCETYACDDNLYYSEHDNQSRCSSCHERHEEDNREEEENPVDTWRYDYDYVASYGTRLDHYPSYKHDTNSKIMLGLELELEYSDNQGHTRVFLHNIFKNIAYLQHDGSLSDGVELICMPMDLGYLSNLLKHDLTGAKAKSYDTSTCGLHIHTSHTQISSADLYDRLCHFFVACEYQLKKLSRRKDFGYCKFYKSVEEYKTSDRYKAINYNSSLYTCEFRLWKGTLNSNSILSIVEITNSIVEFLSNFDDKTEARLATWQGYIEFLLNNSKYSNAIRYINKHLS